MEVVKIGKYFALVKIQGKGTMGRERNRKY